MTEELWMFIFFFRVDEFELRLTHFFQNFVNSVILDIEILI